MHDYCILGTGSCGGILGPICHKSLVLSLETTNGSGVLRGDKANSCKLQEEAALVWVQLTQKHGKKEGDLALNAWFTLA